MLSGSSFLLWTEVEAQRLGAVGSSSKQRSLWGMTLDGSLTLSGLVKGLSALPCMQTATPREGFQVHTWGCCPLVQRAALFFEPPTQPVFSFIGIWRGFCAPYIEIAVPQESLWVPPIMFVGHFVWCSVVVPVCQAGVEWWWVFVECVTLFFLTKFAFACGFQDTKSFQRSSSRSLTTN